MTTAFPNDFAKLLKAGGQVNFEHEESLIDVWLKVCQLARTMKPSCLGTRDKAMFAFVDGVYVKHEHGEVRLMISKSHTVQMCFLNNPIIQEQECVLQLGAWYQVDVDAHRHDKFQPTNISNLLKDSELA